MDGRKTTEEPFGAITFNGEAFCLDFNLIAVGYYTLKRKVVHLLKINSRVEVDWNKNLNNARWKIARAECQLHRDPMLGLKLLTTEKPEPYWAQYMVHVFLVDVKNWRMKYPENFDDNNYHITARWTHGPDSTVDK